MGMFTGIEISSSALTAQRLRMDIISNNIANQGTTRSGQLDADGMPLPHRREFPVFEAGVSFSSYLKESGAGLETDNKPGVRVTAILEDNAPFPLIYNPGHPDADADGYVRMPNVDVMQEMVDMIGASRAYEASISALNASKDMSIRAIEIGR
ncbi:MAG: flagellar basal body rod protein FlgC [Syntrophaceticus sp.]|jgi:flagellar basal-body rod protein FlgC|nr:flagellar basal body rod protein FlgC [Syntrophaceticus sp.]MDD3315502.1 flagellar basal body rod protein FlgC [Syntrophaceticus sp.]MDD4360677.1 flagellar basal body rod protein FlgC [Syntrophaceticus sp.]MDD4783286.1 flagellar basal body rod protein FlgC [Syntrophaceticus sp.]